MSLDFVASARVKSHSTDQNGPSKPSFCACFRLSTFLEVSDQRLFYAEDRIFGKIGTIGCKDMSDDRIVSGGRHNKMDVRSPVGMTPESAQQLAYGTIVGDGIVPRLHGFEPVFTVFVSRKHSTKVPVRLCAFLLNIIEAIIIGLPNINQSPGNGFSTCVDNSTFNSQRVALVVQTDICTVFVSWRVGYIKWPEWYFLLRRSGDDG